MNTEPERNDNQPPRRHRTRKPALPSVAEIERLISQARAIRISLSPFADSEPCETIVREAIASLQEAGAKLEKLTELAAVAQRQARRRSKNKNQPQLPL
jgi:hypothetical protein